MIASDFVRRLTQSRKQRDGSWMCHCPAHDDQKHSLHVSQVGARILLKCHAGCEPEDIVRQMDLRLADLMGDAPVESPPEPEADRPRRPVAFYDYNTPEGCLAYQVVRYEPKDFRCRRPNSVGGWIWSMAGQSRYLYHIDELVEDTDIFFVEGEKDADRLRSLGLSATTTAGGAKAWHMADYIAQVPRGATLGLIPDNDSAGYQYANEIAEAASNAGVKVKLLNLPGVPPKGDVSDWLDRGGSVQQLETIMHDTRLWSTQVAYAPRVERIGDDWNVVFDHYGVNVEFARYVEKSHEIFAEITITTHDHGELVWQNLNLSSAQTRKNMAKSLEHTAPAIPWASLIERACRALVETRRESVPSQQLAPSRASTVAWLMPHLLPKGELTVLFGDGGAGKSLTAMAMGLAIATNQPLTPWLRVVESGGVLYLDWESTAEDAGVRERGLLLGTGQALDPPPNVRYLPMIRPVHEEIGALRREIDLHRVRLVVVDSLGPAMGADPESGETAIRTMGALRCLSPATVLVLAHVSKQSADQKKGLVRPYGSVFVMNLARNVWQATRVEDTPANELKLGLFHRKVNLGPRQPNLELKFTFVPDEGIVLSQSSIVDPELLIRTTPANQILTALASGPRAVKAVHEDTGLSEATVRRELARLVKTGRAYHFTDANGKAFWTLSSDRVDDAQMQIDAS